MAAALLVSMFQTPIYQARTTLEVQSSSEARSSPWPDGRTRRGYTPETYLQTQAQDPPKRHACGRA